MPNRHTLVSSETCSESVSGSLLYCIITLSKLSGPPYTFRICQPQASLTADTEALAQGAVMQVEPLLAEHEHFTPLLCGNTFVSSHSLSSSTGPLV